jgi:hypothetical protein
MFSPVSSGLERPVMDNTTLKADGLVAQPAKDWV